MADRSLSVLMTLSKGKGSSLDIAPLTILDSGALQPRKWQLTGIDCMDGATVLKVGGGQFCERSEPKFFFDPHFLASGGQNIA